MDTRRRREAAAPGPAANAGSRNQTAATVARSAPRNQTAAAPAATGRPHARNQRAPGDIGNHVNAPVVHGEANRRRLTRSLSPQPNAAVADVNTIAPARHAAAVEGASASRVGRAVSGDNRKLSKVITEIVDYLTKIDEKYKQIDGEFKRLIAEIGSREVQTEAVIQKVMEELESEKAQKEAEVQKVMELESEKARKEAEVQKVMEENVRLHAMLDKKEAQLQAMTEQCKFMALNHHN